jgi:RHS repeat-associated protein
VWGTDYVDHLLYRDRDADANAATGSGGLEERLDAIADANWNVSAVVNTSGTVVERYAYDPYGGSTVIDADWSSDDDNLSDVSWIYLHQSGRLNMELGQYSFHNREYDPALGRWFQQDPNPAGLYADGMYLYQMEGSSPVGAMDPMGLGITYGAISGGPNAPITGGGVGWQPHGGGAMWGGHGLSYISTDGFNSHTNQYEPWSVWRMPENGWQNPPRRSNQPNCPCARNTPGHGSHLSAILALLNSGDPTSSGPQRWLDYASPATWDDTETQLLRGWLAKEAEEAAATQLSNEIWGAIIKGALRDLGAKSSPYVAAAAAGIAAGMYCNRTIGTDDWLGDFLYFKVWTKVKPIPNNLGPYDPHKITY